MLTVGISQSEFYHIEVKNLENLNTAYLEYSPIVHRDKLIFTSTRPRIANQIDKSIDEKKQFSDLYIIEKSKNNNYPTAKRLVGEVNSPVHDGIATFNQTGTEIFFTRSNKEGKNKANVVTLKIYSAVLKNGRWTDVKELPFVDDQASYCHPSLSADGNSLYFASNKSGGFGGMDLYVVKRVNGIWGVPTNLGAIINSPSNEVFPFIQSDNILVFSSNNAQSIGGLDLFKTAFDDATMQFVEITNLGNQFNSEADDFGYYAFPNRQEGFFSSNRIGGKGGDDIYHWIKKDLERKRSRISIVIRDERNSSLLTDALVTLFEGAVHSSKNDVFPIAKMVNLSDSNKPNPYQSLKKKSALTGTNGSVQMSVNPQQSYTLFIEKEGYFPVKKILSTEEVEKDLDFILRRKAGIPLNIQAINMPYQQEIPSVILELYNHCTQQTEKVISNSAGKFTFYLACDCAYDLTGYKETYRKYYKKLSTKYRTCGDLTPINTQIYLVEEAIVNHITSKEDKYFDSFEQFLQESVKRVGQTIRLNNVKFDENKSTFKVGTANTLKLVRDFLKKNPEISVELSVHTDARGTAKYNHRLSQYRADKLSTFFLQNGIPNNKISAIGYGEDKLFNHCQDKINCSDEEHNLNNRVEMKIIEIKQ